MTTGEAAFYKHISKDFHAWWMKINDAVENKDMKDNDSRVCIKEGYKERQRE